MSRESRTIGDDAVIDGWGGAGFRAGGAGSFWGLLRSVCFSGQLLVGMLIAALLGLPSAGARRGRWAARGVVFGRVLSLGVLSLGSVVLVLPSVAEARDGWSVEAKVDRSRVSVNDVLTYRIEVTGVGSVPVLTGEPARGDFLDVSPMRKETGATTHRGRPATKWSFVYRLKPTRAGALKIGAASVSVGGSTLSTRAVEVSVAGSGGAPVLPQGGTGQAPQKKPPGVDPVGGPPVPQPGDDYFLSADADREEVYLGQPFIVDYKVYRSTTLSSHPMYNFREPDFEGFWPKEIRDYSRSTYSRDTVEGKEYEVETLRSYVLVPIETGDLGLAQVQVEVPLTIGSRWVGSPRETVKVKRLPSGAPSGFDLGNVGRNLTLDGSLAVTRGDASSLRVGDSVVISVKLEGDGLVEQMALAPLGETDEFLVYGPEVTSETGFTGREGVGGEKQFKLTLVAAQEGALKTPALRFVYFDTASETYVEREVPSWELEVEGVAPGAENIREQAQAMAEARGGHAEEALPALRPVVGSEAPGTPLYRSPVFLLLLGAAPVVWLGMIFGSFAAAKRRGGASSRKIRGAARGAMKEIAGAEGESDDREAVSKLTKALQGYSSAAWEIPARAMTRDQLVRALKKAGAGDKLSRSTGAYLAKLAERRYAGGAGASISELASEARELVERLEAARSEVE